MGTIKNGILGGFSGIVGTVIGSSWKGIDYMRSRSGKRNTSNTPAQAAQRARFALVFRLVQNMKDLLDIGYREHAVRMTASNSALAYTLKNAITGTYPDFQIVYPSVLISRGSLPNALLPGATVSTAGTINFTWSDNSGIGKARTGDKAILVAYCEALNQTMYSVNYIRSTEAGTLNVPAFTGQVVQTWISFIAENGKDIASSIYTGEIMVS